MVLPKIKKILRSSMKRVIRNIGIDLQGVSTLMNATVTTIVIPPSNNVEVLKQGYIEQLANNMCDIYLPILPIEATDYNHVDVLAYSYERSCGIATKKTNFLTVISELTQDVRFVMGTMVLFVMFTILMFMINKHDLKLAVLDMVRLVVSMGLETPLNRLVMKIVLFFGFLFAFLIVPDFQGHLSAILSEPFRRNVETLKELYENKFHVYYWDELENDITNEQLWVTDEDKKYLHPLSNEEMKDCWLAALNNPKIACIRQRNNFLGQTYTHLELHVSKEPVFSKTFVHWTKKSWPLKDKFDEISIKTFESGFDATSINKRYVEHFFNKKLTARKKSEESEDLEQFDFDNLIFNYYFIGYCTAFAFIVFVIEIILPRYFKNLRQLLMQGDH